MATKDEVTAVAVVESSESNAARIERLQGVAATLRGPDYISDIQGRQYPKVEWWTTIGGHAGLTPLEVGSKKITCAEHDGAHWGYESTVEIHDDRGVIRSRASMICISCEVRSKRTGATWGDNGEYAVKSMSLTRATSKAFRINLSYLAVMAGLQPTPAEEVPNEGFNDSGSKNNPHGTCAEHGTPYFKRGSMRSPAHTYGPNNPAEGDLWCNKPEAPAPEQEITNDVKREWKEAMQAVTDELDLITDDQSARDQLVKERIGNKRPRELTPEELYALAEHLRVEQEEDHSPIDTDEGDR